MDNSGSYSLDKCSTHPIFVISRASIWTLRPPPQPSDCFTTYVVSVELQPLTEGLAFTQPLSRAADVPAGSRAPAFWLSALSRPHLESTGNVRNAGKPE